MNTDTRRSLFPFSTSILAVILLVGSLRAARAQVFPTLDPNFRPVFTRSGGVISALGVQSDGKIILAGAFNAINGRAENGLARVNPDGSVDSSFAVGAVCCGAGTVMTGISAPVSALALQKDGKIIIGGSFSMVNGVSRNGVARLNTDGSLDTTFDPGTGLEPISPGAFVPAAALVPQPDGKLLIGGYFTSINGVPRSGVARLNANGSVDTGFDPGTALAIGYPDYGPLTGLALLSNGQIVVAGSFKAFNDHPRRGMARMNADGSLDGSFDPFIDQLDAPPGVNGLVVQGDDHMIISGSFFEVDGIVRYGLARLNTDGSLDESFDPSVDSSSDTYRVLRLQADGRCIAYRQFADADGTSHQVIVRVNKDGSLDPAFNLELVPNQNGRLQVLDTAFQPDGKLLVAGDLAAAANNALQAVIRADASGTADSSFSPQLEAAEGVDAQVMALAVQPDGKVVVGGGFTRVNGVPHTQIARLNRDGSLDSSFAPEIESDVPQSVVSALALQDDGKILLGGVFTAVNGVTRNGIARLNSDGSLDSSFDVGSGTQDAAGTVGQVWALALQPDGKVLVGGSMTTLAGNPVYALGRLNADGSFDVSLTSVIGDCITCDQPDIRGLGVLTNGVIMVSGLFNRVEGLYINSLTRLDSTGLPDLTFVPPLTADEQVSAMQVDRDGKTIAAVTFPQPSGNGNGSRLLRYNADGTADAGFHPDLVGGDGTSTAPVSALRVDDQGRILIAGQFTSVGNVPRQDLARLNVDGTLDTQFDAGSGFGSGIFAAPPSNAGSLVTSLGLQDDGGIIVGGSFATANGEVRLGLARFQGDQSTPSGNRPSLSALALAPDGSVTFRVTGQAGQSYQIEASTDLRTWSNIGTVTGAATPQLFTDSNAKGLSQRFYRATGQ
jgi:uncharacterized delta-60 repeat protein